MKHVFANLLPGKKRQKKKGIQRQPSSVDHISRKTDVTLMGSSIMWRAKLLKLLHERLLSTDLLPLCYWHELLDLRFFYKATHGLVTISPESLPPRIKLVRTTRSTVNPSVMSFRPRKCKTTTFQNSFFVRASHTWNILPEKFRLESVTLNQFKTLLLEYYERALVRCYCPDDPRSFKTICWKCNTARLLDTTISCCF